MGIEQKSVSELIEMAVSGHLDIPELQRDFVWKPEQVRQLAESLFKGSGKG